MIAGGTRPRIGFLAEDLEGGAFEFPRNLGFQNPHGTICLMFKPFGPVAQDVDSRIQ